MQEVHINVTPTKRHQRKRKRPQRGFMDKAVIYCLFMCTVLDAAILALYWHSVTAPDSLAIATMAAPWMVEFGAMATIKKHKITTPADDSQPDDETKGELP